MLSTSCRHSATAPATRLSARRAQAIDASELHAQRREHLADVIVQLARQVLSFFLLRRDELLRELAHQMFGLLRHGTLVLRASLEDAQPNDRGQGHDQAEGEASPDEPVQLDAEFLLAASDLGALVGVVGVVQFFDLRGDRQHRLASRQHFTAQEAGALADFLDERPVEERIERLPVLVELGVETRQALFVVRTSFRQRPELVDRRDVILTKLCQRPR